MVTIQLFLDLAPQSLSQDPPEGFIINYTLLIGDASYPNFQKVRIRTLLKNMDCLAIVKVLDLKGTPRAEQNNLLDTFLTVTSTKPELDNSSFLSSIDMDPQTQGSSTLISPTGSRVHLPSLITTTTSSSSTADSILGVISTPPRTGSPPLSATDPSKAGDPTQKREVFSDLRRLVSFASGLRRDTAPPS